MAATLVKTGSGFAAKMAQVVSSGNRCNEDAAARRARLDEVGDVRGESALGAFDSADQGWIGEEHLDIVP